MKLTLTYQGPLPPRKRGITSEKANLRTAFHSQILAQVRSRLAEKTVKAVTSTIGGHAFVSVVHQNLRTAVELDVLLLTPQERRQVGDTDNRLKTLIDGLTRPANLEQMRDYVPPDDGGPLYCLMDNDALVNRLSVDSRRWFVPNVTDTDALVLVTASIVLGANADMTSPTANIFLAL
ncbi:hypothetical protein ABZ671_29160 [Micromonospora sp. NPDC006766]|uniref:hypothetical protein n=1 Tax=Micromonospora sp. NPDC006766 TaxID=3154778 RepID=UPI0033ED4E3A